MKCGEEKPFCKKCTSSGRQCDGYKHLQPRSSSSSEPPPEKIGAALTTHVPGTALESRTYDFFRTKTVPYMSGYFRDSLWERLVLQASHSEPAIRYALNALGAQHEENLLLRQESKLRGSTTQEPRASLSNSFPMKQYTKALQELQKSMAAGDASTNAVILCSLLLTNYEALRQNFRGTILHAEHAIRLLRNATTSEKDSVDPSIVHALARIDVQGAMFLGWRTPSIPLSSATMTAAAALPSRFHDLTEARDVVTTWTARLYHFMRTVADAYKFCKASDVPLEVFAQVNELTQSFRCLDDLLWELMHAPDTTLGLREHHGLQLLRCRVKANRILAACSASSEESLTDRYIELFDEIVLLCGYVTNCESSESRIFSVSLDEGLLHPLWFTATDCRDGRIRNQALHLLESLVTEGGPWHVLAMFKIAEASVRHEEAACGLETKDYRCTNIPEEKRVHGVGLYAPEIIGGPSGTPGVLRLHMRPNGPDGEWEDVDQIPDWYGNLGVPYVV